MANEKLSLLTFPQSFSGGKIEFNILIIPRNINPLLPLVPDAKAFAEAILNFKALVINKLDGLPVITNVTNTLAVTISNPSVVTTAVWEALRKQIKASDGLTIDQTETDNQKANTMAIYEKVAIRKHLPETYTSAFNFTKPRTRFATLGDEYDCAVKSNKPPIDTSTKRETISWGKVVALILRNPLLAEKAGLIYKATLTLTPGLFDEGGWLFIDFADDSDYRTSPPLPFLPAGTVATFAARIPPLKDLAGRKLFSPIQFPVLPVAATNAAYDEILREAIVYDDGFAKIVHANQPGNHYLLAEKDKSNAPIKDIGIRIGWDDEQMLIWHNRQMRRKEETTELPVEASLGVFGYRIDARKKGDAKWFSQNAVIAKDGITIQEDNISVGDANAAAPLEPAVEIHPAAHGNSQTDGFWLPMYFTNWMGKPLSIPDKDAEDINNLTADKVVPVDSKYVLPAGNTINTIPKKTFHLYLPNPADVLPLVYGNDYEFRVRMMDITGGGPTSSDDFLHDGQRPVDTLHFKRHVGAAPLSIVNVQKVTDETPTGTPMPDISDLQKIISVPANTLTIKRPLLQYPSVVFTGQYADPVAKLMAIISSLPVGPDKMPIEIGLPDPDVNEFLILVEVQTLQMDNARSASGKEPYIKLYEKKFSFSNDFDTPFTLRITYTDFQELDFDGVFADPGDPLDELVLPSSRHLRLSFIPLVTNADDDYADKSIAQGKAVVLSSFVDADQEPQLLSAIDQGLKAIYLQPETDGHTPPAVPQKDKQLVKSSTPAEMARLADTLNLSCNNLTLEGFKGQRVQFGCSKLMRHSLAPDSTSITFSSLAEVFNHFIVAVDYNLNRDWGWDGLEVESIQILRSWKNFNDNNFEPEEEAGFINVTRTACLNSLIGADRSGSRLIFLDAFDPKKANDKFPQEIMLKYRIFPKFKKAGAAAAGIFPDPLHLPVTIAPHQVPKLISAGIALSDYVPDEKYTSTQIRQRSLWLEMAEPPLDPNDSYFVRVLATAPDPMLCLVDEAIAFNVPEEPPLNIAEEKLRFFIAGMSNDFAGLGAMDPLTPDDAAPSRYYMVPLPTWLNASSDELFGFFTYEIAVGHTKALWSTAKARYGRPVTVNGIQHPAPALACSVFRRKYKNILLQQLNEIVVTAPFANAVLNGKNVAANPPQTSLWYLLYAQVKQADGVTNRNILLFSQQMHYVSSFKKEVTDEGTRYGTAFFQQETVSAKLRSMALPVASNLSVLCVEMFPLKNVWRTPSPQDFRPEVFDNRGNGANAAVAEAPNPLVEGLGRYRIYRTSALVAVGDICCDDC